MLPAHLLPAGWCIYVQNPVHCAASRRLRHQGLYSQADRINAVSCPVTRQVTHSEAWAHLCPHPLWRISSLLAQLGSKQGGLLFASAPLCCGRGPGKPCLREKKIQQYIRHLVYPCQCFFKKKPKKLKSSTSISAWTHNFQTENYHLLKNKSQPRKSEDLVRFTDGFMKQEAVHSATRSFPGGLCEWKVFIGRRQEQRDCQEKMVFRSGHLWEKEKARVLSPRLTLAGGGEGVLERVRRWLHWCWDCISWEDHQNLQLSAGLLSWGWGGGSDSIWGQSFHN